MVTSGEKKTLYLFIGIIFTILLANVSGEKILVLEFLSSKSHKNVYDPLLYELAQRGHSVTVVSPFKSPRPHKNIKDVIEVGEDVHKKFTPDFVKSRIEKVQQNPFSNLTMFENICKYFYESPEVMALKKEKFNLVIASSFMNECTFGLIHHFNTTFMFIVTFSPLPWTAAITGTPSPPSFVPLALFNYRDRMSFPQRILNFLGHIGLKLYSDAVYIPQMEKIYRRYLGENIPSVKAIEKNASLIMANSHFTLNNPRPYLPDIVEVGGMHCRAAEQLPTDLNEFLSGSGKDGFIYFSLGTVVQTHNMPEKFRKIFLNAFGKLKQRVIWKWDTETMDDLPKNVKLGKYLPQQDILGHPNIKLFITHGGLLSLEETVYHGVPLIGMPFFGDQDWNMQQAENHGFAITLEFGDLTEEILLKNINKMLTIAEYSENVKRLSSVFRDRPQKPLETAVFWTEYVMRHNGATHLRSPARDLCWFSYHSYDVICFLLVSILLVFYILKRIIGKICCSMCNSSVSKSKKRN